MSRFTNGHAFQSIGLLALIFILIGKYPVACSLAFLEKLPTEFECVQESSFKMIADEDSHLVNWKHCTKTEICASSLPREHYRPVETDIGYLNNWVDKLGLLCRPKKEVGFIGSCFFIGIILSITWVPPLADSYGRLPLILISMMV